MTSATSKDKATANWSLFRVIVAALLVPIGGIAAVASLSIHEQLSGHEWQSRRYYMDLGRAGWQIFDAVVALLAGGVFFGRLAWLAIGGLARRLGQKLPMRGLYKGDVWLLGTPGVLLAYLIYVANFEDASFWPIGIGLVGVYILVIRGWGLKKESIVGLGRDDARRR